MASRPPEVQRCQRVTEWGTQCTRPGNDTLCGFPLCPQHEATVIKSVEKHLAGNPQILRKMYFELVLDAQLALFPVPGRSVVYFAERQGLIKIGTTTDLTARLRGLSRQGSGMIAGMTVGPVRLLATMPGDQRHEKFLHTRFGSLRIDGEWFLPDSELCEFIQRLPGVDHDLLHEVEIRHGIADEDEVTDETA